MPNFALESLGKSETQTVSQVQRKCVVVLEFLSHCFLSIGARIIYDKTSESYPPDKPVLRIFGFTLICPNQRPYRSPRILLEVKKKRIPQSKICHDITVRPLCPLLNSIFFLVPLFRARHQCFQVSAGHLVVARDRFQLNWPNTSPSATCHWGTYHRCYLHI